MIPILSQILPDPQSAGTLGWIIVALGAVVVFVGSLVAAMLGVFSLIEKIRGTQHVKATTKAADDGPGRIEFDLHKRSLEELRIERKEDVSDMKASLREINDKLDVFSGDQYKARGRMHRRINTMDRAMNFWAGKLAGQGDPDAAHLQAILNESREDADAA
jgi:hypothetical protein